jgi:type I restriction enzyme S subunit
VSALPRVPLGEVARFVRGITFKPEDVVPVGKEGSVACMRTRNVQVVLDLADVWGIPSAFVKREDQFLMDGDLLVSSANSWNLVGKCCWVPSLPWRATFGGFVSVLRADRKRLDPRFLYHWFSSANVQAIVRSFGQQTTNISNLNFERCLRLEVALPTLPEQQRIAAILDQADALRAKRRAALAQLDALAQSIFLDMFGDPATNPKGWPVQTFEEVSEIVSGATPRTDVPEYWEGDVSWVTPKELSGLEGIYISRTERLITEAGLRSCAATMLPAGAVLFSSRAPIGHTAICAAPMATNQGFKSFVPRAGLLDEHFLLYWLRLRREFLERLGTGATFKEVSKAVLSRVRIAVPPVPSQMKFAQVATHVESLRSGALASLALVSEQFATLQDRAFRGEL